MPYFKSHHAIYYVICLCVIAAVSMCFLGQPDIQTANATASDSINQKAITFLQSLNYQTGGFIEMQDVVIPPVFDKVYKNYNDLQKRAKFDLTKYRGQKVVRYTYSITNYPGDIPDVRANLLFFRQEIIGGDIMTVKLDGFMVPLLPRTE